MKIAIRHLRVEIWRSLHEIPIKSEGVFLVSKNQRLQRHQLIRRVDVYRGYQIHVDFNFDLAQYLENRDTLADKIKSTSRFLVKCLGMEITGIEPVTSCMPCKRSPS